MIISLSLKQHAYIIAFLPAKGDKDVLKYIIQVATKYDSALPDTQPIEVTVSEQLVADIYATMGQQQERLTYKMNEELRTSLLPQVSENANVMQAITTIAMQNITDLSNVIDHGKNFLQEIKP